MQKDNPSQGPRRGYYPDEKFRALTKIVAQYHGDAEKSADAGAYYAACVMIGAAFEAMLLQALSMFEDEVADAVRNLPRRPRGPLEYWNVEELIKVAIVLGWRPPRGGPDAAEAGIGELGDLLKRLRNLSYAARRLRESDDAPAKAADYRGALAIFDSARDWVRARIDQGPPPARGMSPYGRPEKVAAVKAPREKKKPRR